MKTGLFFAFLSVLLGAFGAHWLKARVSPEDLVIWQTAVQYQFFHALALILFDLWKNQKSSTKNLPSLFFTIGVILFSGSLYLLVLTQIRKFGMITPLGGLSFMGAWILWLNYAFKSKKI